MLNHLWFAIYSAVSTGLTFWVAYYAYKKQRGKKGFIAQVWFALALFALIGGVMLARALLTIPS